MEAWPYSQLLASVQTARHGQWRTQNFRMGGVEVPQAPRGVGRSIPLPNGGRVWGGGWAPPQKIFRIFC